MEAATIAHGHAEHDEHHGPPPANRSSRVEPQLLGMLLFIISEIMVFGAFFTAYFFIRVVRRRPRGSRPAGTSCRSRWRASTPHPRVVVVHAALGRDGVKTTTASR